MSVLATQTINISGSLGYSGHLQLYPELDGGFFLLPETWNTSQHQTDLWSATEQTLYWEIIGGTF